MQRRLSRVAGTVAAAVALVAMAPPSDPVAVYAVVDRVAFAPDSINPATIQIWGTFAVSEKKPGDNYLPAVKGYLYYRVDPANERASRVEWKDLQAVAGSKSIVGFASKWVSIPLGRVRCITEVASNPDVYPTQNSMGVTRVPQQRNTGWPVAKNLLSAKVPDAPCSKAD
jgi:hypothetical protein